MEPLWMDPKTGQVKEEWFEDAILLEAQQDPAEAVAKSLTDYQSRITRLKERLSVLVVERDRLIEESRPLMERWCDSNRGTKKSTEFEEYPIKVGRSVSSPTVIVDDARWEAMVADKWPEAIKVETRVLLRGIPSEAWHDGKIKDRSGEVIAYKDKRDRFFVSVGDDRVRFND